MERIDLSGGSLRPGHEYIGPDKRSGRFSALKIHARKALSTFERIAKQIKAIALDIIAVFPIAAVALYTLKNPRKKDIDRNQPPILMVHGFLGMSSNWIFHRHRLQQKDVKNIFTLNLGSPHKSIEAYAAAVAKKVQEIKELTGRDDIILVGHSMGGLVIDAYKKLHANKTPKDEIRILDTITVGTPITGTGIAVIASLFSKCARQMVPSSAFSQRRRMKWKETRPDGAKVQVESFKVGPVRVWKQVITHKDGSVFQRFRRIDRDGSIHENELSLEADGTARSVTREMPRTNWDPEEALHIASEYDTIVPYQSASDIDKDMAEGVCSSAMSVGKGGHVWQMVSSDISEALYDRIRLRLPPKPPKNEAP